MGSSLTRRWAAFVHIQGMTLCCLLLAVGTSVVLTQETPPAAAPDAAATDPAAPADDAPTLQAPPPLLLERLAFDVVVVKNLPEKPPFEAEVLPLEIPGRVLPPTTARTGKIKCRILEDDSVEYEVDWADIIDIKFFEQMLFEEAKRLQDEPVEGATDAEKLDKKLTNLDEAYRYFTRLEIEYPRYPGLTAAVDDFLYLDAGTLYKSGRYAESLAVMEQLFARNPGYKNNSLPRAMGALVNQVVKSYVDVKDYRSSRIVLDRLASKYSDTQGATIQLWRDSLTKLATENLAATRQAMQAQQFHEAIELLRKALDISPDVPGGKELELELSTTYPQVIVGVTQPALQFDAGQLDDWAARRAGRLLNRTIVEFLGPGSEGGDYQFPFGTIERSADGRLMTFHMNSSDPNSPSPLSDGYALSRRLLQLADVRSPEYHSPWASLVAGVSVKNVLQVDVDLRRSHVMPQSLLGKPITATKLLGSNELVDGTGQFRLTTRTDTELRFLFKGFQPNSRLAEVIEQRFDDAQGALNALRRGQIDVIDRLFPSDAARLQSQIAGNSQLTLEQYALPTVHMLIPKSEHPYLQNRNFRRALIFGIDREMILRQELLGGRDVPGCRVINGPFPAGIDQNDPLGYAYDHSLDERKWNAGLTKLLTIVATKELEDKAKAAKEEPPKLTPLVLTHPANEPARIACQAIASHLSLVGIQIQVRELPIGVVTDPENKCDLLYAEIAIWEPVSDARKLLGAGGVAGTTSPFINQGLKLLDEAENWGQVRDQLLALHRATYSEATIIPLWQTVDFFVYNNRLRNVGDNPVWLYQNIDQWRLNAQTAQR